MKTLKVILASIGSIVAIAIVAFVVVFNIIPTRFGAEKVSQIVSDNIKGTFTVKDIDYSLFSTFPNVKLELDSVLLISDVLDKPDSILNCGRIYAFVNLWEYLSKDKLKIDSISLLEPNILCRIDRSGISDWEVYESKSKEPDTSKTVIPDVLLRSLGITNAHLRYIDERADRHASVDSLDVTLHGYYGQNISGGLILRCPKVSYSDSSLRVSPMPIAVDVECKSDTMLTDFDIKNFKISLDDVSLALNGKLKSDATYSFFNMDMKYDFQAPDLEHARRIVPYPYNSYVSKFKAGGSIGIKGTAVGLYKADTLPVINGKINADDVWVKYDGKNNKVVLNTQSYLCLDFINTTRSYVKFDTINVAIDKSFVATKGRIDALLSDNPHFDAMATTSLYLDQVAEAIPKYEDLTYSGNLQATAKARFDLNDAKNLRFDKLYVYSYTKVPHLRASMPSNGISFYGEDINIESGVNSLTSKRGKPRCVVNHINIDTMYCKYGNLVHMSTKRFLSDITGDDLYGNIPYARGSLEFIGLKSFLNDTIAIVSNRTKATLRLKQDTVDKFLPMLTANIKVDSMMYFSRSEAALADSVRLKLTIKPRARKFRRVNGMRVAIKDSERKYVGTDSLIFLLQNVANSKDPFDQSLKSFCFDGKTAIKLARYSSPYFPLRTTMRRLDLKFTDDTIRLNKFRMRVGKSSVNLKGDVQNFRRYLRRGKKLTANLDLTSKRINFNEILNAVYQGEQTRETFRKLKEAQRMGLIKPINRTGEQLVHPEVFERGFLQKVEQRRSKRNEDPARRARFDSLMARVEQQHIADSVAQTTENESDDTEASDVALDSTATFQIFCLPNNLDINFNSKIDTVRFANLIMKDFKGGVQMKNSTLLLHDLKTNTNIGSLALNAMYHCNNTNGADCGIDMTGSGVDITNLVNTLPQIDSLVPMLRSFQGVVTLDLAAKTQFDSAYNVLLPTLSAATVIRGDSLVLMDGETFSEIAKLLMFKKKTKNLIDNISVELLLQNNEMQVLPFMVEMDKYRVAVGGENTLDMKFNYHISVLKSPLPMKLGVNVSGTLDDMKIRLGKAKYKDEKVITKKGQFSNGGINVRRQLHDNLKKTIRNAINSYAVEQKKSSSVVKEVSNEKK